jgi:FlgD Ig-like domain
MRGGSGRRLALAGAMLALLLLALAVFLLPFAFPTPPPIVTRFDATQLFSPNGDGRRDAAKVSVRLRVPGTVRLEVTRDGETVRTLLDGPRRPGRILVDWDGTDADGATVPDGDYALRLAASAGEREFNIPRRMTVDTVRPPIGRFGVESAALAGPGRGECRLTATPDDAGTITLEALGRARGGVRPVLRRLGPRPARAEEEVRWQWNGRDARGRRVATGLHTITARLFDAARNRSLARATCWVGHVVGTPRRLGLRGRIMGVRLARPDGTPLAPSTPTRLALRVRLATPGREPGPVLGPQVGREGRGRAGRVTVRLPPGRDPAGLWLMATTPDGRALVPLDGAP